MVIKEVLIDYPFPGDKRKRHHMVIQHVFVEEAAKQLNLDVGDTFFIIQYPDRSNRYMRTDVGQDFIDEFISGIIKGDEIYGSTVAGVGEGFRRPVAAQGYCNYWLEGDTLIKQYHVVPGY